MLRYVVGHTACCSAASVVVLPRSVCHQKARSTACASNTINSRIDTPKTDTVIYSSAAIVCFKTVHSSAVCMHHASL
jgi:hypothetical protein